MSSNPMRQSLYAEVEVSASPTIGDSNMPSNRTMPHEGMTKRKGSGIGIIHDAELFQIGYYEQLQNLILCCSQYDLSRSYLYVRENSIEFNYAINCFFCFDIPFLRFDNIGVQYFDRNPYVKGCRIVPTLGPLLFGCPLFTCERPKLEVVDPAYLCCFKKMDFCCPKKVAFMPFENMPFPLCCCSNRYSECNSCWGLCGPVAGSPIIYHMPQWFPQPVEAEEFINKLKMVVPDSE